MLSAFMICQSLLIDLPFLVRWKYANNVTAVDLASRMPGHVDIPRLRKGKVGGFFWQGDTPFLSSLPHFP